MELVTQLDAVQSSMTGQEKTFKLTLSTLPSLGGVFMAKHAHQDSLNVLTDAFHAVIARRNNLNNPDLADESRVLSSHVLREIPTLSPS